jgi:hypothetical protein
MFSRYCGLCIKRVFLPRHLTSVCASLRPLTARVFTTMTETQDMLDVIGYSLSVLVNGIICLQIVAYSNSDRSKKDKKEK